MKYSPECVAAFEAKFGGAPEGCERLESGHYVANHYHCGFKALEHNAKLQGFAANWERVRELEDALHDVINIAGLSLSAARDSGADVAHQLEELAEHSKLLEKGNE